MTKAKKMNNFNFILVAALFMLLSINTFGQRYWNVAAHFDGNTNSKIVVAPYTSLQNLAGSFTVECWFNCEPGGTGTLFGKNGFRLMLESSGDKVRGRMQTNNNTKLYTRFSSSMETNKWYHLACSYSTTTNVMSFYINGNLDTTTTGANYGPVAGTDSVLIGTSPYGSFKGMIDDIRVWNRALTAAEISKNMRNPYVGAIGSQSQNFGTGLVMSATFDFTYSSGGGLYFYDGYNNYTNQGATSVNIGLQPSTTLNVNSSLDLTAPGYVRMPNNADIQFTGQVTAEAWIYPLNSASGSSQYIVKKGNDYSFYLDGSGKLRFIFSAVGSSVQTIPSNRWTHIAITCTPTGAGYLYVNGEYDSGYNFGTQPSPGTDTLFIGSSGNFLQQFNGYVDGVKISNYVKTAEQIKQDMFKIIDFYNKPSPPNSTVSLNFDYNQYSSTSNGGWSYHIGNAKFSNLGFTNDIPVSPMIGNNIQSFPIGYFTKRAFKRIPESGTAGYMQVDSLAVATSVSISNMQLFIALNHGQLNDLRITLIAPTGDSVIVWDNNSGINSQIENLITVFDDNADSLLVNGKYTDFSPTIKPLNSFSTAFSGKNPQGVWRLRITDLYNGNTGYLYSWGLRFNNSTGVEENYSDIIPNEYVLEQNYPNPFNPTTTIRFAIPSESNVRLKVYDILGNEVATLVNDVKQAGSYTLTWDGENNTGNKISSGVYFYRLETGNFVDVKKMLFLK